MFKSLIIACAFSAACATNALAGDGLIKKQSAFSFEETASRLEAALVERNIAVMSKIDHAAAAADVDIALRPTTLLIFGNPAIGSQLMAANQSIGLDLPLKALVFEDEEGVVFVEYGDMRFLALRHGVPQDHAVVARVASALDAVSNAATQPDE